MRYRHTRRKHGSDVWSSLGWRSEVLTKGDLIRAVLALPACIRLFPRIPLLLSPTLLSTLQT